MPADATTVEWRFQGAVVRLAARELLIDDVPVKLGARAFDVLVALVERRGRTVDKNELLEIVWPDVVVEENNLQVQVSALRKLLGPQAIATIPGRGYQFVAPLDGRSASASPALPSPKPSGAGNLPPCLPALIAREHDLRELVTLIESCALVTVVGAAGIGKTAIAHAAAQSLRDRWPEGSWWVDLASIHRPAQLPHTVALALRLVLNHGEAALPQLVEALQARSMLLVLDNCEHLVDAVAALADALLTQAPGVRLLVTSQELLNVPGEKLVKLGALAVPSPEVDPTDPAQFGAVQLFVELARSADSRFQWSAELAGPISDICRQLDGLPLAIELAAARVRLLGVHGVRDRLGERFRVLTGGARTAMRRHQTLHAAIDWSHALLSAPEKAVLRRLAIFVGGFTLELAQREAADEAMDEWAVLDALSGLVDKSLVVADAGEPPRYRLFDSTRVYALERLADAHETQAWIERHALAVYEMFVQTEEARNGDGGHMGTDELMRTLVPELDNFRAALEATTTVPDQFEIAVGLAAAAAFVFHKLGLVQEAMAWMQPLAQRLEEQQVEGAAAAGAAVFWKQYCYLGDLGRLPRETVIGAATRAEAYFRRHGPPRRLYMALYGKGWVLNGMGQHAEAELILQEMAALEAPNWPAGVRAERMSLHAAISDLQERFEESWAVLTEMEAILEASAGEEGLLLNCRTNLAFALASLQRYEEVVALVRKTLESRSPDRPGPEAFMRAHLTTALTFLGRLAEAEQSVREALPVWRRAGLLRVMSHQIALLLAEQGYLEASVRVHSAATAFRKAAGLANIPLWRRFEERIEQRLAAAGIPLDDVTRWRLEGETLDEAGIEALFMARKADAADAVGGSA